MGRARKDNVPFTRRTRPEFIPIVDAFLKQLELNDGMVTFQGCAPMPEQTPEPKPEPIEPPANREGVTPAAFLRKIGKGYLVTEAIEDAEPKDDNFKVHSPIAPPKQDEEPTVTIADLPDEIREFLTDNGTYDFLTLNSRKIVDTVWFRNLYEQLGKATTEKAQNIIIQKIYDKIQEIGE